MKERFFKDWLIVVILIGAGLFYLIVEIVSIIQNGFTLLKTSEVHIMITKSEIMYEIRTWTTTILSFAGGILYYKIRKAGWILASGILFLFVLIAGGSIASIFVMGMIDTSTYFLGLVVIILIYSLVSLFTPTTRKQFGLIRNDFLVAGLFVAGLFLLYFLAQ